ncbi:MAG: ABC transporter permease subunit [Deltaproteobacteria bacterium]|nr:MAG: ABC transporter permease subunit [Deltaproteobacteria bacterium]
MSRRPKPLAAAATHAALTAVTAAVLYPVALVVKKAFEPGRDFALSPSPVPRELTLDNFAALLGARGPAGELLFARYAANSAIAALATTAVGVLLACTAAYALSRHRFRGRNGALSAFLLVQMFPSVLLMMPLYVLLDRLGLLNSLLGLVLVYATTAIPFCVWTLKGYFDTLPRELEEAARIDGASSWGVFFRIILPLARPGIAITALFSFMTAWNEFILASTFMTDETAYTLPVLLKSTVGEYSAHWGHFAAGAVLTSLPVMALFYALQRYLVGGLTAGSVKG